MGGVRRGIVGVTAALSLAVTAAIAAKPLPWSDSGGAVAAAPAAAAAPSTTALDERERAILDRARAVEQGLRQQAEAAARTQAQVDPPPVASVPTYSAPPPVAAAPTPPVAVTPAAPVTSSASS